MIHNLLFTPGKSAEYKDPFRPDQETAKNLSSCNHGDPFSIILAANRNRRKKGLQIRCSPYSSVLFWLSKLGFGAGATALFSGPSRGSEGSGPFLFLQK